MRTGEQLLHHRPNGRGAKHQSLFTSTGIEHAIGENMARLKIGPELDSTDREEGDVELAWHRLHGAHPESGIRRLDLFLAGDQGNRILADTIDNLVVNLARQQPQRQSDDAAGMRQHALDGEMGLSGVSRTQHRRNAGAAGSRCSGRLLGKTDGHYTSGLAREPRRALSRPPCITMRQQACACVKLRTSLERNAPESLTPELYDFVHGDIWRAVAAQPQDGVAWPRFKCALAP